MKFDIVRAWKDASYRSSLSAEELSLLPTSPAGELELSDAQLEGIQGAHGGGFCGCCDHEENSSVVNTVKSVICNNSALIPINIVGDINVLSSHDRATCNSFSSGSDQSCNIRTERDGNVI